MLKKVLFAIVPVFLFTVALRADDSLGINLSDIQDADVSIVDESFDIDVDKLASDAGAESEDQAIEACFRSFGYRSYGYCNYGYNYGCYGGYGYNCYRPYFYTYRPVYYSPVCYAPCYTSYWGCY
ncbi:hypothetical protein [Blastopirellula marina]|uniref:Uncharacterized protein n=1 Tax=Blastopirellula marina TaxID=124 RepID=A0A2S8GIX9_9BACT|nr:hypothetical protein [Blastopirellula marina]PQO44397.1 hypothetical protein C5Y93_19900 [Blastopirellula marina]